SVQAQLDSGRLEQRFATAEVFADTPAKAAGSGNAEAAPMAAAMGAMRAARSDVLIVSPYFVPGESGMAALQDVLDKQVQLTVVTNSLGATDEPLVHWGYARYRQAMLKMGVSIRELGARLNGGSSNFGHSSLARLHAKLAVVDQQRLFIGSMNMDRRSERLNTELLLAIDSRELSAEVASLLTGEQASLTYRLRLAGEDEHIEWVSTEGPHEVAHRTEPDCGWGLRLKLATLSAFVNEENL